MLHSIIRLTEVAHEYLPPNARCYEPEEELRENCWGLFLHRRNLDTEVFTKFLLGLIASQFRCRVTPHNVRVYPKSALLCNPAAVTMAAAVVAPDGPRSLAVFGPRARRGGRPISFSLNHAERGSKQSEGVGKSLPKTGNTRA